MSTMITEDCVNCGLCVRLCPNDGISKGETAVVLDRSKCSECVGFFATERCAEVCPVEGVCIPDPDHRETEAVLFARALAIHANSDEQPRLTYKTSHFRKRASRKWWKNLIPALGS